MNTPREIIAHEIATHTYDPYNSNPWDQGRCAGCRVQLVGEGQFDWVRSHRAHVVERIEAALAAEGLTICREASTGRSVGDDGALMYAFVPVLEHTPEERYERPPYDADDAADYPEEKP